MTYTLYTFEILMSDFNKGNCISGIHLWVGFSRFWPHPEMKVMSRMKGLIPKIGSVRASGRLVMAKLHYII